MLNKYSLTLSKINQLRYVGDWDKLEELGFGWNGQLGYWIRWGSSLQMMEDGREKSQVGKYGAYNEYCFKISKDRNVEVSLYSYGGMCGYVFENFFEDATIENDHDLYIQKLLLEFVEDGLDRGLFEESKQLP